MLLAYLLYLCVNSLLHHFPDLVHQSSLGCDHVTYFKAGTSAQLIKHPGIFHQVYLTAKLTRQYNHQSNHARDNQNIGPAMPNFMILLYQSIFYDESVKFQKSV
jgi:hypothetical protein